ncbi:MAG: CTB family bacteriocin [Leptolyngbya sp. Prado105]|jgi:hypothetical protein|nr:CTB family bacteriocin [Leptolyngbya sp. Prado105]
MIINELTYQEIAVEANELEGGLDLAITGNYFKQDLSMLQSGTTSGPAGTLSFANAQHVKVDTSSFSAIALGL